MLTRVDFTTDDFEQIIQQKGYLLLWEKQAPCPCIDPATSHAVPDCVNCDGRGKYFYESVTIKGIITRQNKELQIGDAIGALEPGNAYLTTSHTNFVAPFDRITNLDSLTLYTETVVHSNKTGDELRYPVIGNVVFAVTQTSATTRAIALKQNVDFTISGNKITWISQNTPADQLGVSFRYFYNPVWLVTRNINYVRDTWVTFNNPVDTVVTMP